MDKATLQQTSHRHSLEVQIAHTHWKNNSVKILHRFTDIHVGNVLHVISCYFIDTQAGVVHIERLLLHYGDTNIVLSTAIAYRSVQRYGYCVSCTVPFGVYHVTLVHRCIVPALVFTDKHFTVTCLQRTNTTISSAFGPRTSTVTFSITMQAPIIPVSDHVIYCKQVLYNLLWHLCMS